MRRTTGLFDRIATPGNLLSAFLAARKGKASQPDVRHFAATLDANLAELHERLLAGTCRFDRYSHFTIHDPKKRVISVAPFGDRVLHHALMDVCAPGFERAQVFDSYACLPGKGTRAALDRAAIFARRFPFYLKLDVRKYFGSVSHERLKALLARLFKEPRLLALLDAVIDGYSPHAERAGVGLPIGNLTSQYFANHYLAGLDHHVKESLRGHGYVRYMDDMVLWGGSSRELLTWDGAVRRFCNERLGLELKPPCINCSDAGLPFLGFVVLPGQLRLSSRSCRRVRRRLKSCELAFKRGWIDQDKAAAIARGVLARTDWAGGVFLRRELVNRDLGHCPRAGIALSAAAAGTTGPGTAAAPTATGTSRATGTTTSASALFSPPAQGNGRMSSVEPGSDPVPCGPLDPGDEVPSGGRVLVARADARDEGSRPPTFLSGQETE